VKDNKWGGLHAPPHLLNIGWPFIRMTSLGQYDKVEVISGPPIEAMMGLSDLAGAVPDCPAVSKISGIAECSFIP
jgi:hypothetical protein